MARFEIFVLALEAIAAVLVITMTARRLAAWWRQRHARRAGASI